MPRAVKQVLEKRADGRYRCKYKDKTFYSSISSDDALKKREKYIQSLGVEAIMPKTVAEYAVPWLKRTYPSVKDSTKAGLATHLQHLIDEIGNKNLSEVVPSDIKGVYSKTYKDYSNTYILAAKQLYCSLFDSAVADGLCRSNPARDKTAKPHRGSLPSNRPITPQEREWIHTYCTDHRAYPVVMTMLYAGLRPQEAKAVKIERDVDFESHTITVNETAHNDGQKYDYTEEGKTEWSNRTIPLFPPLEEALKGREGYLITSAHGERVTHTTWRVVWNSYKNSMEEAINGCQKRWYGKKKEHEGKKLPPWKEFDIVPYSLRKSFCVMCRDAGVEINTCRKWMGHADTQMILKVYDSVSNDRSEAERMKVESRLGGQNGGQQKEENAGTVDK